PMAVATQPMGTVDGDVIPLTRPARRKRSRFTDYHVVAPIARGGMGGVYLAEDGRTGEQVALKVLDPMFANHPEVVERLLAEHTLAARIDHPGVLEIRGSAW